MLHPIMFIAIVCIRLFYMLHSAMFNASVCSRVFAAIAIVPPAIVTLVDVVVRSQRLTHRAILVTRHKLHSAGIAIQ